MIKSSNSFQENSFLILFPLSWHIAQHSSKVETSRWFLSLQNILEKIAYKAHTFTHTPKKKNKNMLSSAHRFVKYQSSSTLCVAHPYITFS